MSLALRGFTNSRNFIQLPCVRYRWKAINRGKFGAEASSIKELQKKWNHKDPEIYYKVNIGFSKPRRDQKVELAQRLEQGRTIKKNFEMQKAARNRTLVVSLQDVAEGWHKSGSGGEQTQGAAEYYGVFNDLFGETEAYFLPVLPINIQYSYEMDEEYVSPVHRGNLLKSYETLNAPKVSYQANPDDLFTLVMSTPDGHFTEEKGEYLHWHIGNIPGNKIEAGEELCHYLRPFPTRGAGYFRYCFVLYKQDKRLDFSKYKLKSPCYNLTARTFSSYDFYRENQDYMTPASLAFFQSDWDQSLTKFFHDVLEMKEPSFEYDFNEKVLRDQEWFPRNKPFNIYMDKYKEEKVLQRELLIEKLKEVHPFDGPAKRPKYPLAHKINQFFPTWLKDDIKLKRMREGKWKFM